MIKVSLIWDGRSVKNDHLFPQKMQKKMKKFSIIISLSLALFNPMVQAQDFVDNINNTASATKGQCVVYEMNVGSFTQAGTFAAASDKLDDLKQTGVDIVWLMPVYPRGGGINSPYAAKNFRQVNLSYGTVADLKAFVGKAHQLGMKVWLDWVPNHTATARWCTLTITATSMN